MPNREDFVTEDGLLNKLIMKILVTGAAGFIGFHLCKRLLERGDEVIGLDCINDYYDTQLKYSRLAELGITTDEICESKLICSSKYDKFHFIKMELENRDRLQQLFKDENFDKVMNLAAQAGVRYSITNPYAYVDSNLVGFVNLLECCRNFPVKHFVYASSSSVYGTNAKVPFSEDDRVDNPVSLYAATKKANELMAHVYAHLYGIATTGLRFFTVYGPWGRPDMAPILFANAISKGEPIKVFNNGNLSRDFTYIDDIIEGTIRVIDHIPTNSPAYKIYNIGCGHPTQLMDFIHTIEQCMGIKAKMNMQPMQPGDVYQTYADTTKLEKEIGYKPKVKLTEGIDEFIKWYKIYKS